MDVKLEDFVITEPQATVTNGATSAKVVRGCFRRNVGSIRRKSFQSLRRGMFRCCGTLFMSLILLKL